MDTGKRDAITHHKIDEWDRKAIKQAMDHALLEMARSKKIIHHQAIYDVKFANNCMLSSYVRVMQLLRDASHSVRTDQILFQEIKDFEDQVKEEHSRLTLIRNKMAVLDPTVINYEWVMMNIQGIPKTPCGRKTTQLRNYSLSSSNTSGSTVGSDMSVPNINTRAHSTAITSPGLKSTATEGAKGNKSMKVEDSVQRASSLKVQHGEPFAEVLKTTKKPKLTKCSVVFLNGKQRCKQVPIVPEDINPDTNWRSADTRKNESTESCNSEEQKYPKPIPGFHPQAKLQRPINLDGSYLDEQSVEKLKQLQDQMEKGGSWVQVISPKKLAKTSTLTKEEL